MAELALALLTHQFMPESNHHLVFTEHLSWKAENPLPSCFIPWPVFLAVVFSFWLLVLFHPLSPHQPLEPKDPKEQVSVPPSHLPAPPCTSKKALGEHDLSAASRPLHFLYHLRGVFNGFQGHHAGFGSHYCSLGHEQESSRVHHILWCWCRGTHTRLWWDNLGGGTTTPLETPVGGF